MEDIKKEQEVTKEIEKVLKEAPVVEAMTKLKKDKVEVLINPKKYLLDYSVDELSKLEKQDLTDLTEQEKSLIELAKKNHKENVEKYSQCKIDAVMIPLKYRDLQLVKDSIVEAVKYNKKYGFDDDIALRAMIREEHTMSVFLALRKKNNINTR